MSHTSQRRGLDPEQPGREVIVLAMVPSKYKDKHGMGAAMSELAEKMLEHRPHNWLSRNFTDIRVPDLGPLQGPVAWMHKHWPERTERLLMHAVGRLSSVVTAVYTDPERAASLIKDLKGKWLERNREEGLPISIVLSGLFSDARQCCRETGTREHTYLHSLGFFGRVSELPGDKELEIITMCGHGLVAPSRVRHLIGLVKEGSITPGEAAEEVARPCVCGIVNKERAEGVFRDLTG